MNYSVVKISGKQYRVEPGSKLTVDKLEGNQGDTIQLDQILLQVEGGKVTIGQPVISGKSIKAKIIKQTKAKKIRVAKYKAKSRYRRVKGHRQLQTTLEIANKTVKKSSKAVSPKTSAAKKSSKTKKTS